MLQTYVINLERDQSRRDWMRSCLEKFEAPYTFIPAVVGAQIPAEVLDQFVYRGEMTLSKGETGCLLSHVNVWREVVRSGAAAAVVCEDDIVFSDSFPDIVRRLEVAAELPVIIKLETFLVPATISRRGDPVSSGRRVHRLASFHAGTGAYAISRAAAERLLELWPQFALPIDRELFNCEAAESRGIHLHQMRPAPCIQWEMFAYLRKLSEAAFPSVIDAERIHDPNMQKQPTRFRSLYMIGRQVKWLLQSVAMAPSGMRRAYIAFR